MLNKVFVCLAVLMLAFAIPGCSALLAEEPLPTLAPTIALTFVSPVAPETARMPADTATLPTPLQESPTQEAYPGAADTETAVENQTPQEAVGDPLAAQAAETATQTPAAVIIVGEEETFIPVETPGSDAEPTSGPTGEAGLTDTPEPTQPSGNGGGSPQEWDTIFLVAIGDNGTSGIPGGCGDSLIEVSYPLETPTDDPLQSSLLRLLGLKTQLVGDMELYNPLWQSEVGIDRVVMGADGYAEVSLSGQLNLSEECDPLRVQGMIEQTVLRVPGVQSASITFNGTPIEEGLPSE